MELKSDFEVSVGVDRAWEVLTNPELIAPCLPGRPPRRGGGRRVPGAR